MAYFHLGGEFPVEMKLSIQDAQLPYGKTMIRFTGGSLAGHVE
ncbi:MAG: hypothetical protein HRT97_05740 [Moritella sp.]|nr:hypothetical protein [Moritella sp.]